MAEAQLMPQCENLFRNNTILFRKTSFRQNRRKLSIFVWKS